MKNTIPKPKIKLNPIITQTRTRPVSPPPPPINLHHVILSKLGSSSSPPNPTRFNQILAQTLTTGLFHHHPFTASRLLASSPNLHITHLLFSQIDGPDLFSYNLLIKSQSQSPTPLFSLSLYQTLLANGLHPNEYTFCFLLTCCSRALALSQGRQLHCHLFKHGLHSKTFSATSLVHLYGECSAVFDARKVFGEMPQRSSASWGAVLGAFVSNGFPADGLRLFKEMRRVGVEMSSGWLLTVIRACSVLGDLAFGRAVHGCIVVDGVESSVTIGTTLIDMYSKCGAIEMASQVFSAMEERNVVSYNALIHGLAMNGHGKKAVQLFEQMNVSPNEVTFLGLLQACSHAGLTEQGLGYFSQMGDRYQIKPNLKHYASLVDLYGRVGRVTEAMEIIRVMPMEADAVVWGALLGACSRIDGYERLAEALGAKIVKMVPWDECGYMLLSDSFAKGRRWDDVVGVRKMMREMEIKKAPGCSAISL